jgi:hypothetical protein
MIRPGIYQHYKGPEYRVYDICRHSETEETLVVYRCLYGNHDLWVRPLEMFTEEVEVDGKMIPRFRFIEEGDSDNSLA